MRNTILSSDPEVCFIIHIERKNVIHSKGHAHTRTQTHLRTEQMKSQVFFNSISSQSWYMVSWRVPHTAGPSMCETPGMYAGYNI